MQPLEDEFSMDEDHPSVEELVGFLRGEATRDTARCIVRHLLAQCPQCVQVTRWYWQLAERPAAIKILLQEAAALEADAARRKRRLRMAKRSRRGVSAMTEINAAREQLREIVRALKTIRSSLQEVRASLPEPFLDLDRLLEDEADDVETEIRSVIACVLTDWIRPAIRDLEDAAAYGIKDEEEGEGKGEERAPEDPSGEETE